MRIIIAFFAVMLLCSTVIASNNYTCNDLIYTFSDFTKLGNARTFRSDIPTSEFVRLYSLDLSYLCDSKTISGDIDPKNGFNFLNASYFFLVDSKELYTHINEVSTEFTKESDFSSVENVASLFKLVRSDLDKIEQFKFEYLETNEILDNAKTSFNDICFVAYAVFDILVAGEDNICRKHIFYDNLKVIAEQCGNNAKNTDYFNAELYFKTTCDGNTTQANSKLEEAKKRVSSNAESTVYFKMSSMSTALRELEQSETSFRLIGQGNIAHNVHLQREKVYEIYKETELYFFRIIGGLVSIIFIIVLFVVFLFLQYKLQRIRGEELSSF